MSAIEKFDAHTERIQRMLDGLRANAARCQESEERHLECARVFRLRRQGLSGGVNALIANLAHRHRTRPAVIETNPHADAVEAGADVVGD